MAHAPKGALRLLAKIARDDPRRDRRLPVCVAESSAFLKFKGEPSWPTNNSLHASTRVMHAQLPAITARSPAWESRTSTRWPGASHWTLTARPSASWPQQPWPGAASRLRRSAPFARTYAPLAAMNAPNTRWITAKRVRKPAATVLTNATACPRRRSQHDQRAAQNRKSARQLDLPTVGRSIVTSARPMEPDRVLQTAVRARRLAAQATGAAVLRIPTLQRG